MKLYFVFLALLAQVILGFCDSMRSPVFPELIRDFDLSDSAASWYFSLSSAFGFMSSFLCPYVIPKVGLLRLFLICQAGLAISIIVIAQAPYYSMLLFGVAAYGLFMSPISVMDNMLVFGSVSAKNIGRVMGALHGVYGLGSLLAPLAAIIMIGSLGSWRFAISFCAIFPLLLILLVLLGGVGRRSNALPAAPKPEPGQRRFDPRYVWFGLLLSLAVVAELVISSRLPLLLRREYGYDLHSSSDALTFFFVGMLAARLSLSIIQVRAVLWSLISVSLGATVLLYLLGLLLWPYLLAYVGLAVAPSYPLIITLAGKIFRQQEQTTVVSYCIGLSGALVVLMHYLLGVITDHYGIRIAFLLGVAAALGGILIVVCFFRDTGSTVVVEGPLDPVHPSA